MQMTCSNTSFYAESSVSEEFDVSSRVPVLPRAQPPTMAPNPTIIPVPIMFETSSKFLSRCRKDTMFTDSLLAPAPFDAVNVVCNFTSAVLRSNDGINFVVATYLIDYGAPALFRRLKKALRAPQDLRESVGLVTRDDELVIEVEWPGEVLYSVLYLLSLSRAVPPKSSKPDLVIDVIRVLKYVEAPEFYARMCEDVLRDVTDEDPLAYYDMATQKAGICLSFWLLFAVSFNTCVCVMMHSRPVAAFFSQPHTISSANSWPTRDAVSLSSSPNRAPTAINVRSARRRGCARRARWLSVCTTARIPTNRLPLLLGSRSPGVVRCLCRNGVSDHSGAYTEGARSRFHATRTFFRETPRRSLSCKIIHSQTSGEDKTLHKCSW